MNEITHEQARNLIQMEADGLLEQSGLARQEWANLHAHLEMCAECRAEERRMRSVQRELRSALRAGLDAPQPPPVSTQWMIAARETREQRKRWLLRAAIAVPIAALVLFLLVLLRPDQLLVALLDPWGAAAKEFYGSFDGKIVFEGRHSSNLDLYLLQGGALPQRLTDDAADDSDPTWSPDGAWVAFLSDRVVDPLNVRAIEPRDALVGANIAFRTATPLGWVGSAGKREIFMLSPGEGAVTVQVSSEPALAWVPPLNWAGNGKSLAIVGKRLPAAIDNQGQVAGDTWVYTQALDGSHAQPLTGTRGASWIQYGPDGEWLGAIIDRMAWHNIAFIRPADDLLIFQDLLDLSQTTQGVYLPGGGFSWSPGGSQLAYLVEGPYIDRNGSYQPSNRVVTQLRRLIGFPNQMQDQLSGRPLAELPVVEGLRDVSWSLDGSTLVMLQGSTQDACWAILVGRAPQVAGTEMQLYPVEGLCAVGKLTQRPWTPDGRWLVFTGRWHGNPSAIYALDVKQIVEHPNYAPLVARLTDPSGLDRHPQVQPVFPDLGIQPQAVAPAFTPPEPVENLALMPGELVFNAPIRQGNVDLVAIAPRGVPLDGQPFQMWEVSQQTGSAAYPVWSPPGANGQRRVAWVQNVTASVGTDAIPFADRPYHLMFAPLPEGQSGADSAPPEPVDLTPDGLASLSAPSWSPGGSSLATIAGVSANGKISTELRIYGADSALPYSVIRPQGIKFLSPVAWSPEDAGGGARIAALVSRDPTQALGFDLALALVDLSSVGQGQALMIYQSLDSVSVDQVRGLAWSPQGDRVAVLSKVEEDGLVYPQITMFSAAAESDPVISQRRWVAAFGLSPEDALYDPEFLRGDLLRWRNTPDGGQLSFVVNDNRSGRVALYPPEGGMAQVLLNWNERIEEHVWSPDGAWLAFSTESGIWLLNVEKYQMGELPYRLLSFGGWDMDWK